MWDVGTRKGTHLDILSKTFKDSGTHFLGINPVLHPDVERNGGKTTRGVPILQGFMEDIADPIFQEKMKATGVWPPDFILLRNVLKYPYQYGQDQSLIANLSQMLEVLTRGGSIFIYEDTGEGGNNSGLYAKYESAVGVANLNASLRNLPSQGDFTKSFLRIKKL